MVLRILIESPNSLRPTAWLRLRFDTPLIRPSTLPMLRISRITARSRWPITRVKLPDRRGPRH